MNVLILEIGDSHIECTYSFLHILKSGGHDVSLACNEKLIELFPERNLLNAELLLPDHIKPAQQLAVFWKIRKFIKKNKITHLVINTTELKIIRNLMFFIPKSINCTGLVHNAKKLENGRTFIKILSKKMWKYFVLGDFLLSKLNANPIFKVMPFYPIYFPEPAIQEINKGNNEFWIIVPGLVDQSRRDYKELLTAIKNEPLETSIRIVFLGKLNADSAADIAELVEQHNNIKTFNEFVDYDTFHSYMKRAELILPLIKLEGDEMYGDGRISGSYNLGLGYQLAFLLPATMKENKDLSNYSFYYSSIEELVKKINKIATDKTFVSQIKDKYPHGPFATSQRSYKEVCDFIKS